MSPTHQSPWTPNPWQYFFKAFSGFKVRAIRWLPALLLFVSCVSPEAFHLSGPLEPVECPDDGTDWYFVDCPENPESPTEPISICTNEAGQVRASGCIYSGHGFNISCVAKCEGEAK